MAHTFDIRFDRSSGLAGLLREPSNSFRWKGSGNLRIDSGWISIGVRRGLLRLFPAMRRIEASDLKEVYREGEALRLTFATAENPNAVVSCWTADADTAAKIVERLPTSKTVELERGAGPVALRRKPGIDRRLVFVAGALIGAIVVAWVSRQQPDATAVAAREIPPGSTAPVAAGPPAAATAPKAGSGTARPDVELTDAERASRDPTWRRTVTSPAEAAAAPREGSSTTVPIENELPNAGYSTGIFREHFATLPGLERFEAEVAELRDVYERVRLSPNSAPFIELEARWWKLSTRIYESPGFGGSTYRGLLEYELGISRSWRNALWAHAESLRQNDASYMAIAHAEIENADSMTSRLRAFAGEFIDIP